MAGGEDIGTGRINDWLILFGEFVRASPGPALLILSVGAKYVRGELTAAVNREQSGRRQLAYRGRCGGLDAAREYLGNGVHFTTGGAALMCPSHWPLKSCPTTYIPFRSP